jgi:plastocyanin
MVFLLSLLVIVGACSKSDSGSANDGNGKPGPDEVYIQNLAFSPSTITVSVNTTVIWTNFDQVAHTVTSDTGLFDSGNIASSNTYSFKFTSAGTFTYHCKIHPSMTGTVIVNQT